MIVTVLVENSALDQRFGCQHGLSIVVQSEGKQYLFDFGASDLFQDHARLLGIDLEQIDAAVLSHGHQDHGGGLKTFLITNKRAKVYAHRRAFEPYFSRRASGEIANIGLDPDLKSHPQIVLTGDVHVLNESAMLFAGIDTVFPCPRPMPGCSGSKTGPGLRMISSMSKPSSCAKTTNPSSSPVVRITGSSISCGAMKR